MRRIAVIGPGAMGSLLGGYLFEGGLEVTLVDKNPQRSARVNAQGLRITGSRGEKVLEIPSVLDVAPLGPVDLVLVTVKAYDTAGAMAQHRGLVGPETTVLTLQNGLGNVEALRSVVGEGPVLGGTTTLGANELEPGVVQHAGEGDTYVGEPAGGESERARAVAASFGSAGIQTRATADVTSRIWHKVLVNVGINPLTAIARVRNGEVARNADLAALSRAAVLEGAAVARAAGVALPLGDEELIEQVLGVAERTGSNRSSMLMDRLRGQRTEIDRINGAIVDLGRERDVPTPVNETLARLVRAIEATPEVGASTGGEG